MELAVICPHTSWSGAEGAIVDMDRWPILWVCDSCGHLQISLDLAR
jgi:hypothetical protein